MKTKLNLRGHKFHDEIIRLVEVEKKTEDELSEILGLGWYPSYRIYKDAKRDQNLREDGPLFGLPTRVLTVCFYKGLKTRSDVEKAINDGSLYPYTEGCHGYGWDSHIKIHKWLGLPEPVRGRFTLKVCPHCGRELPGNPISRREQLF